MQRTLDQYPDTTGGLGIDTRVAREIKALVLDPELEIDSVERIGPNKRFKGYWDQEKLLEYSAWLCGVLDIHPNTPGETLSNEHLKRASKLGLGASPTVFRNNDLGIGKVQELLGLEGDNKYRFWSRSRIVTEAMELTRGLGRRPIIEDFDQANREGKFLSGRQVIRRLGSTATLYEEIGFPSCRGWMLDDYVEWGVAVKRQNERSVQITASTIEYFSALGRGPSVAPVYLHCGDLINFNFLVDQRLEEDQEHEKQLVEDEYAYLDAQLEHDDILQKILEGRSNEAEILRISAQYRLIRHFIPRRYEQEFMRWGPRESPDDIAAWLIRRAESLGSETGSVNMGEIECAAEILGIFDRLWPMQRFRNVDLELPDDWWQRFNDIKNARNNQRLVVSLTD